MAFQRSEPCSPITVQPRTVSCRMKSILSAATNAGRLCVAVKPSTRCAVSSTSRSSLLCVAVLHSPIPRRQTASADSRFRGSTRAAPRHRALPVRRRSCDSRWRAAMKAGTGRPQRGPKAIVPLDRPAATPELVVTTRAAAGCNQPSTLRRAPAGLDQLVETRGRSPRAFRSANECRPEPAPTQSRDGGSPESDHRRLRLELQGLGPGLHNARCLPRRWLRRSDASVPRLHSSGNISRASRAWRLPILPRPTTSNLSKS